MEDGEETVSKIGDGKMELTEIRVDAGASRQ